VERLNIGFFTLGAMLFSPFFPTLVFYGRLKSNRFCQSGMHGRVLLEHLMKTDVLLEVDTIGLFFWDFIARGRKILGLLAGVQQGKRSIFAAPRFFLQKKSSWRLWFFVPSNNISPSKIIVLESFIQQVPFLLLSPFRLCYRVCSV
jgi:hypothetical protein